MGRRGRSLFEKKFYLWGYNCEEFMKRFGSFVVISLCAAILIGRTGNAQSLLPKPVKYEGSLSDTLVFEPTRIALICPPEVAAIGQYLENMLWEETVMPRYGSATPVLGRIQIRLLVEPWLDLPSEGYRLSVTPQGVTIVGKDYAGVFYGVQTFLQLLPPEVYAGQLPERVPVACCEITDYPRFPYRGMMLDVARTFAPKEEVMRFIEHLARHKINRFHWHLADDEGWRIEIKSHPELTQIGGFRGTGSPVRAIYGAWDQRYGGFYTQEDIREVIEFARMRNVEIIPEIDLPGHSRTIALIHPEILCDYAPDTMASGGYDRRNVWCASREENYQLLDDILREVCALFPSSRIHVGGDEVDVSQWAKCPRCRALMEQEGIADFHLLEDHMMLRIADILARYGKRPAVWNEAVESGKLPLTTRVHGWQGIEKSLAATEKGYSTVVMPSAWFYFDMKQSAAEPGLTWAGVVDTRKCYSFNLDTLGFTPEQMQHVVGVEGAFWSEVYLSMKQQNPDYLDYQCYPRICALAEVGWTPQGLRNWDDFQTRLTGKHYARMDCMGIRYRAEAPVVEEEHILTPPFVFASSFEWRQNAPAAALTDYRAQAMTTRTCRNGDYFLFTFAEPVACARMEFVTGYTFVPRYLLPEGYAEVSYDGEHFERIGSLDGGRIVLVPSAPVRAVRIVATAEGNGERAVIVQPPRIVAPE